MKPSRKAIDAAFFTAIAVVAAAWAYWAPASPRQQDCSASPVMASFMPATKPKFDRSPDLECRRNRWLMQHSARNLLLREHWNQTCKFIDFQRKQVVGIRNSFRK